MGCPDQLAVKQDFTDQDGRLLSQLATQEQANEILSKLGRVETGIDTSIPGAIANIVESIVSLVRDPIVAAIDGTTSIINNGIDALENVIVSSIKSTENVLVAGINGVEGVLVAGFETVQTGIKATEAVLNNAIDATENVIVKSIEATENVLVKSIEATESVLNNAIDATKDIVIEGFRTVQEVLKTFSDILHTIEIIVQESVILLGKIFDFIIDLSDQIDKLLPTIADFLNDINQKDTYDLVVQISNKLGSFPLYCQNGSSIPSSGSVADAFELILCGGRFGNGTSGNNGSDGDGLDDTLNSLNDRALLEAIANAIGVKEFPGEVPKTLLNSGDNPETSGTTTIPNLTQFVLWIVKQMDALIGEFPIKIKIKDADLVEEGNQELNIEVRNVAEALGDAYGHGASSLIVQNAHTNILLRLAAELVSIKTATLINQDLAIANQDFMGFRTKRKKRDAESAFDIAKANPNNIKSLSQILKSGKYKYQGFEFDDSAILLEYLPKFMFAASIIKSVHLRTDESDIDSLQDLAADTLDDADNGWNNFVDEVNNPESFLNLNEPDRPFISDINDEDQE